MLHEQPSGERHDRSREAVDVGVAHARADDWRMYWVSGARISAARWVALNSLKAGGSRRSMPHRVSSSLVPAARARARRGSTPHAAAAAANGPVVGFHLPAEDDFEGKRRGETVVHG